MRRYLAILLLLAGWARAQPASAAGTTVDQNGKPLAGVHVRLVAADLDADSGGGLTALYGAISDSTGQFSFEGLKTGMFLVMAERRGFIQKSTGPLSMLALKDGQQLKDYKITMTARATISGRVVDEYGDPVQGASVQTQSVTPNQMGNLFFGMRDSRTDDRGEFRLVAAPGKYYLKALDNNMGGSLGFGIGGVAVFSAGFSGGYSADGAYVTTYYPSATGVNAATAMELGPGQDLAGVEIRLQRASAATGPQSRMFSISGTVGGLPENASATVMIHHGEAAGTYNEMRGTVVTDPEGKFSVSGFPPGFYSVQAFYSSGKAALQSRAAELHLEAADASGVELSLSPGEDLSGKLELTGDPADGLAEKHTVRLETLRTENSIGQAPPAAEVDADGSFRLSGVMPSKYKAVVEPMPENGFVKEIALDGKAPPDSVLDFSQGVSGSKLKITVSRNGGQVSGRVLGADGEPAVGLIMVAIGTDAKNMDDDNGTRVKDSHYTFKGLRPGKYRIVAMDIAEMLPALTDGADNDEMMQRVFDAGTEVEIKEGDHITKDVTALTKLPEKKGKE